jgi:hypothetical protein
MKVFQISNLSGSPVFPLQFVLVSLLAVGSWQPPIERIYSKSGPIVTAEVEGIGRSTLDLTQSGETVDGIWVVDLRPTPDAAPYTVLLEISVDGNRLSGIYYDTAIKNGFVNDVWGVPHIGFTTSDGSGIYYTSARLENGVLRGSTLSTGRGFLAVWTATRQSGE